MITTFKLSLVGWLINLVKWKSIANESAAVQHFSIQFKLKPPTIIISQLLGEDAPGTRPSRKKMSRTAWEAPGAGGSEEQPPAGPAWAAGARREARAGGEGSPAHLGSFRSQRPPGSRTGPAPRCTTVPSTSRPGSLAAARALPAARGVSPAQPLLIEQLQRTRRGESGRVDQFVILLFLLRTLNPCESCRCSSL